MKLHEETLRVVQVHGDGRCAIVASDGRMLAETRAMDGHRIAHGLAAMPRLTRTLLAVADYRQADDGQPCWCACREGPHHDSCVEARAVLRDVGALEVGR